MKARKLPIRPSKLINSTLEELAWIERSKKYEVDMESWIDGGKKGKVCSFCFGGAALMGRLGRDERKIKTLLNEYGGSLLLDEISHEIDYYTAVVISALDLIREYKYMSFLDVIVSANNLDNNFKYLWEIKTDEIEERLYERLGEDFREVKYSYDPKQFKKNMKKIAKEFERMGL